MTATAGGHITSEEAAAYLDNTLSEAECARIKAHLADCDPCRAEIVEVSKLLAGAPRSRRRYVAISALAAAAVLAVVLVRPSIDSTTPAGALRGRDAPSTAEGASVLQAIAPIGAQANATGIVFTWHPALSGATYRFTLTDDRGGRIWVGSTSDTTLALPRETTVIENRDYHWYVDALQADGSSATTGITSFRVVR